MMRTACLSTVRATAVWSWSGSDAAGSIVLEGVDPGRVQQWRGCGPRWYGPVGFGDMTLEEGYGSLALVNRVRDTCENYLPATIVAGGNKSTESQQERSHKIIYILEITSLMTSNRYWHLVAQTRKFYCGICGLLVLLLL